VSAVFAFSAEAEAAVQKMSEQLDDFDPSLREVVVEGLGFAPPWRTADVALTAPTPPVDPKQKASSSQPNTQKLPSATFGLSLLEPSSSPE
jgi:hypothetical protein